MLWQLKKLSTNEPLNEPQELPNDWGPIFGLHGFIDKLGDLSWLGPAYTDMGWVEVEGEPAKKAGPEHLAWEKAKKLLRESDWAMLPDIQMTVGQKQAWMEYRRILRNIRNEAGFPHSITWPVAPE